MASAHYDFLVIGGGSGGVRAARRAAGLGKKTALFERERMGGTCVLKGCIPKKLMVYGSQLPEQIKLSQDYGWSVSSAKLNWKLQKERRDQELSRLSAIYTKLINESGVKIIHETASFTKEGRVRAGGCLYKAPHILIAVGGCSHRPQIPGIEHILTSDDIFQLNEKPQSLIVVGAGYIALEFAGIFNSLGIPVTLLCRKERVLNGFDQDVRSFFQEQAPIKGLNIVSHFEPTEIQKTKEGLVVKNAEGKSFQAQKVLFATGRKPFTQPLNLQEAGITLSSNGCISVSSSFETSVSGIYAIGDCADTPYQLTPVALAEAEVLVKNLFTNEKPKMNYNLIPSAVFSNPPIACVGLTEEQAVQKGLKIKVFETRFRHLKNTMNPQKTNEKVFMKMIVDDLSDRILGCHIIGDSAPEIIQSTAVAMIAKARKKDFDSTIGVHPSVAEELCTMRQPRS